MKTLLIITAAASLLAGCATSGHHTEQWEYKTALDDNTRSETPEVFLNNLGKEGWMLVQHDSNGRYFFKRPRP
jgi:hypothetical protein